MAWRMTLEGLLFLTACALGAFVWISIASYYENAGDIYWTAHGHPAPVDLYAAPHHLRFVILLAPYAAILAVRLALKATTRLRS